MPPPKYLHLWLPLLVSATSLGFGTPTGKTEIAVVSSLMVPEKDIVRPDPTHPVYYLPIISGFMQPVNPVAFGPKPPPVDQVAHELAVALFRRGYRVSHPGLRINARLQVAYADGTTVLVPPYPRVDQPIDLTQPGNEPLTVGMIEAVNGPYSFRLSRVGSRHLLSPLIQTLRTIDPVHGPVLQAMPALVITIQWGELHSDPGGQTSGELRDGVSTPQTDLPVWIEMLAGDHLDQTDNLSTTAMIGVANMSNWDKDDLVVRAASDRFFVVVSAFDFKSCLGHRKKVLLWRTRMSLPSNRDPKFANVLPVLLKAGESQFGRETAHPQYTEVDLTREGTVTIGTPIVKDYQEVPASPPNTGSDRFLPLRFEGTR